VVNDELIFTPTLGNINQPMFVGWYAHAGADDFPTLECGWSDDGSREFARRFFLSGHAELWKGGELVAPGEVSGGRTAGGIADKFVGVMLLPFRRRELLVYSTGGDGFVHLFEDLDEDGTVQEIVPNTKFWVRALSGTATFQIAKV